MVGLCQDQQVIVEMKDWCLVANELVKWELMHQGYWFQLISLFNYSLIYRVHCLCH